MARTRGRSRVTFRLPEVVPVVERVIAELLARQGRAARDEIVSAFMTDPEGHRLVAAAMSLSTNRWPDLQVAGNMVDWFSANFAVSGRLTASARDRFRREKYLGKWAYFPANAAAATDDEVAPELTGHYSVPRAFMSYSHDSDAHKEWVALLERHLRMNGVDVVLDQWDLRPGQDAALFMEQSVASADWVLIVCTDAYVRKANEGRGGAGYEKMIMTAELVTDQTTNKFIPIIRGTTAPTVPTFISTRIYIDFTDDTVFDRSLDLLLRTIHGVAREVRPPIGPNPYAPGQSGTPILI